MRRNVKHTLRLMRILWVLARHDAFTAIIPYSQQPFLLRLLSCVPTKHRKLSRGDRLARALVALGPSFIKLGQSLSTRSDMIGEDVACSLAYLQDKLPPFNSAQAVKIIETSLGKKLNELYTTFEMAPVAAASIAQVHFATTLDGKDVAVKILRPNIREAFARDLDLFLWMAEKIDRKFPEFRRMRPLEMVATLKASVEFELDLRYEAAAADELKTNLISEKGIFIPSIDWLRTSGEVLTLERIVGTPMNNIAALRAKGFDFDNLIQIAANAFFQQVFRDGFFHADMHPGNLFVLDDGRIAAIDCGIMGRLDLENRIFLAQVLRGFLTEDYETVARVHMRFGVVPPHKSMHEFAQACRAIGKPILDKPLNEISIANLLGQLFKVSETFEMILQPQFLLLQKTMMLTEGIGRALNPNVNMWKLSEPLITQWGMENLTPRALLKHKVKKTIRHLVELPEVMEKFDLALEKYLADQEPRQHTTH